MVLARRLHRGDWLDLVLDMGLVNGIRADVELPTCTHDRLRSDNCNRQANCVSRKPTEISTCRQGSGLPSRKAEVALIKFYKILRPSKDVICGSDS